MPLARIALAAVLIAGSLAQAAERAASGPASTHLSAGASAASKQNAQASVEVSPLPPAAAIGAQAPPTPEAPSGSVQPGDGEVLIPGPAGQSPALAIAAAASRGQDEAGSAPRDIEDALRLAYDHARARSSSDTPPVLAEPRAAPPEPLASAGARAPRDPGAPPSPAAPPTSRQSGGIWRSLRVGYVAGALCLVVAYGLIGAQILWAAWHGDHSLDVSVSPGLVLRNPNIGAIKQEFGDAAGFMIYFLGPVYEEYLFRAGLLGGMLWGLVKLKVPGAAAIAVVLSSLLFALIHGAVSPILLASLSFLGVVLGRLYLKEGLITAIFAHVFFNAHLGVKFIPSLLHHGMAVIVTVYGAALALAAVALASLIRERRARAGQPVIPQAMTPSAALLLAALVTISTTAMNGYKDGLMSAILDNPDLLTIGLVLYASGPRRWVPLALAGLTTLSSAATAYYTAGLSLAMLAPDPFAVGLVLYAFMPRRWTARTALAPSNETTTAAQRRSPSGQTSA